MKTAELLSLIEIPYYRLAYLLRSGKVRRPSRDVSGHFVWREEEVERVKEALSRDRRVRPRQ